MIPPFIQTEQSLTVVIDGKALTMAKDHPSWDEAITLLCDDNVDMEKMKQLFDVGQAVENYAEGNMKVEDGAVHFKGEIIHNVVVDKILSFMQQGLPFKPVMRFLQKLLDNPSRRAVEELYTFLEHKGMPITESGNFVAYKGVNANFTDFFSGKFDNSVGQTLEMQRNSVCDDADIGCSYGFHAGSYDYAKGYASGGGHLMLVEIDPRDVVSVPKCCDCQKLRTSKYVVVSKYETIDEPPLEDGIYGDYNDDYDDDNGDSYAKGYEQAKKDILDKMSQSYPNN
jgi:hypothetical protein